MGTLSWRTRRTIRQTQQVQIIFAHFLNNICVITSASFTHEQSFANAPYVVFTIKNLRLCALAFAQSKSESSLAGQKKGKKESPARPNYFVAIPIKNAQVRCPYQQLGEGISWPKILALGALLPFLAKDWVGMRALTSITWGRYFRQNFWVTRPAGQCPRLDPSIYLTLT